jgi:hypothetical protein
MMRAQLATSKAVLPDRPVRVKWRTLLLLSCSTGSRQNLDVARLLKHLDGELDPPELQDGEVGPQLVPRDA